MFLNYRACVTKKHVQTADGTLLPVAKRGSIKLVRIALLIQVLNVSKLFVNLLSTQRIAKSDEHKILFDSLDAFLCNKVYKWKIGLARIYNGLYYLPGSSWTYGRGHDFNTETVVTTTVEEKAILLHRYLGHPSFSLNVSEFCQDFINR